MQTGARFWTSTVVCLTSAQVIASAVLPRGFALTTISDFASLLLFLALATAFAQNAVCAQGRLRVFWIMQAVGFSISLINQAWWIYYDVILQEPVPMMFVGDLLLFFPGALMLAGFLLRPHLQQSKRSARLGALDFLLLMLWLVYLYVYLVMCWQYVSPNEDLYNRNYDRLYLVEVLVVTAVLGVLIKQTSGAWRRLYCLYLGAVAFNYITFAAENRVIELHSYFIGCWYDSPYTASFALFMALAMAGRGLKRTQEQSKGERYGAWLSGVAVLAVLSLPIMVLVAALEPGMSPNFMHFRVLVTAVAMFGMAGLVFMKQQLLHVDLTHANQVLEESSTTDPLTGIRNRRFFTTTIHADIAQCVRAYAEGDDPSKRDLIFYLVDLDNFKRVNDLYGHDAGDRVLIEASRRISSAIRNSDVLVRWGGEEFLIISRYTDRLEAAILAERVLDAVRGRPFSVGLAEDVHQTCSIGWAAFPWHEENVEGTGHEEVLKFADRGLYRAKKAGKNQAVGMMPPREEVAMDEDGELAQAFSPARGARQHRFDMNPGARVIQISK